MILDQLIGWVVTPILSCGIIVTKDLHEDGKVDQMFNSATYRTRSELCFKDANDHPALFQRCGCHFVLPLALDAYDNMRRENEISVEACIGFAAALVKWKEIREANGNSAEINYAALYKSCLLRRLLSGKEPLPLPPPTAYSAPWYEIVEEGYAERNEVNFYLEGNPIRPSLGPAANINQFIWDVVKEV